MKYTKQSGRMWLLLLIMAGVGAMLGACSDKLDTDEEYSDWQARNDAYFLNVYHQAEKAIAAGDTSWKIIRKWSLNASTQPTQHVVVHVLDNGTGGRMPLYTDSVAVDYQQRLMPTVQHTEGYLFDKTWSGDTFYEPAARPASFVVSGLIDGWVTALQQMPVGAHWIVYVPYELGYGASAQTAAGIPAYSTLIADIRLRGAWSK